jgi:hypothetical protein
MKSLAFHATLWAVPALSAPSSTPKDKCVFPGPHTISDLCVTVGTGQTGVWFHFNDTQAGVNTLCSRVDGDGKKPILIKGNPQRYGCDDPLIEFWLSSKNSTILTVATWQSGKAGCPR